MDLPDAFSNSLDIDYTQTVKIMKKLFDALLPLVGSLFMCLGGCSTATNPSAVDLTPAISHVKSADKSLTEALHTKILAKKDAAINEAKQELSVTQTNLVAQQDEAKKLEGQRDWWQHDSQDKQITIQNLQTRVSHLDHLLFLCSALISLAAMAVGWELLKGVPYGAWLTAGVGATVFSTAWFGLGHLL